MEPITFGFIGILCLFVLLLAGIPVGFSMMFIGFFGFTLVTNFSAAINVLTSTSITIVSNYDFCVLPLFLLMAGVILGSGFGKTLYDLCYTWMGRIPGGLAIATILACALFAAASASSIATAITMGAVAVPEMRKYKYDLGYAGATVASGGTLGVLIPPSGILIVYGIITETSISELFIAGIIPGLMLTALFTIIIFCFSLYKPNLMPRGIRYSVVDKFKSLLLCLEMLMLIALVIIGLIVGMFTPTEAGAVGAFGAIVLSLIRRKLSFQVFINALKQTFESSGMIFTIIIGSFMFNSFLTISTIPMQMADMVLAYNMKPIVIITLIIISYFILGCFLDAMSMILLTIPIYLPIVLFLGYSPVWFGIIVVLVAEVGMITPPVGMNIYIIKGIYQEIPIEKLFKSIFPYLVMMILTILILVIYPNLVLLFI